MGEFIKFRHRNRPSRPGPSSECGILKARGRRNATGILFVYTVRPCEEENEEGSSEYNSTEESIESGDKVA